MRPPRYRFPEEVRSTTRGMASRMAREGTVAETPEQLDAWISQRPDVRDPLVRGGYGTKFASDDLFPLLQVFLGKAATPAPEAEAPPRFSKGRVIVWLLIFLAVLVFILAMDVYP